ncbi:uncharacterized protein BYT42DRAFT_569222 [Radiomyces spectabilis]|uniref:uncharacterized protein n=1 Tax=Radiomyces spectabilis TaxID=64574 RepID=UPI00221FB685|nr:uncharacterized protein BYT42DRAFT_569222 [Radiomyces spectabilis]KAI8379562.1 hypothetical protein BYT42DRAFT_569222 [Radiomyces spectabilis]
MWKTAASIATRHCRRSLPAFKAVALVCPTQSRLSVLPTTFACFRKAPQSFFSTSQARWNVQYSISELTPDNYHRISDRTMDRMVEVLEDIGDETDIDGFDLEYSQGVMTLKLGEHGTYVINKQPPNQQIWLSSPKSGPKRYDYDAQHKRWFYHRDNHTLDELLKEELSEILNRDLNLLEDLDV